MAAKRNGLGKGLDSLIPNKTAGKSEKTSSKKSSGDSKKLIRSNSSVSCSR